SAIGVASRAGDQALDETVQKLIGFSNRNALPRYGTPPAAGWSGGNSDATRYALSHQQVQRAQVMIERIVVFAELFVHAAGTGAQLDIVGLEVQERMKRIQGQPKLPGAFVHASDLAAQIVVSGDFNGAGEGTV